MRTRILELRDALAVVAPTDERWQFTEGEHLTLLDIMYRADVGFIAAALFELAKIECKLSELRKASTGDAQLVQAEKEFNKNTLAALTEEFKSIGFQGVCDVLEAAIANLGEDPSLSRHMADLNHVSLQIVKALQRTVFLYIPPEKHGFTGDLDAIWGKEVLDRFSSAVDDATQACHCLSVDANTAAVFHLMRVAEFGLRAVARDRRVEIPKGIPLDLATWEEIIRQLEDAEESIRTHSRTHAREAQLAFYHGAMVEFRAFKNVWRNRTMHAREQYDPHQAMSVFTHVRDFMRILSSKISENGEPLPEVWGDAECRTE